MTSSASSSADFHVLDGDTPVGEGRVALVFEYNGSGFHGWQYQKSGIPSVEGHLQQACSKVANHEVELVCAGRTDAGVHASAQVVHFDTPVSRSMRSWVMGINTALPPGISVRWAGNVDDTFHARFSAVSRRYRYIIASQAVRPAIGQGCVSWTYRVLDSDVMNRAGQHLVGEHDFSAFRAAGCQSKSPFRNVHAVTVTRHSAYVVIDIQANAFLHHMVRNIAGALMAVGSGEHPEHWIRDILSLGDRRKAAVTAPPNGLFLVNVGYPQAFGLPCEAPGPAFIEPWMSPDQQQPIPGQRYEHSGASE